MTRTPMVIPRTYGRMGNFLFQAATAIAYAHDHGMEFTLPSKTNDAFWNPLYLQHLVKPDYNERLSWRVVEESKEFFYAPIPFQTEWRNGNIVLDGYWQSERYFAHIREEILKLFGFQWKNRMGHVSVHVRRGDYLTIRKGNMLKHPPVPKRWLEEQMTKFPGARFIFFSDDLLWCRANFSRPDCFFHEGSEVEDLVAMSWCEHHICSASTFSWWGAWLNRNPFKRVIMPKHWLTPGWNNHLNMNEIVPKEWERA